MPRAVDRETLRPPMSSADHSSWRGQRTFSIVVGGRALCPSRESVAPSRGNVAGASAENRADTHHLFALPHAVPIFAVLNRSPPRAVSASAWRMRKHYCFPLVERKAGRSRTGGSTSVRGKSCE